MVVATHHCLGCLSYSMFFLLSTARGQPRCNRPPHLAITVEILQRLLQVWSISLAHYEVVMLGPACTGEFTVVPGKNQALVAPMGIQVDSRHSPTYVVITLHGSKTDPFGVGCTLYIGHTDSRICPVTALLAHMAIRPPSPAPLFVHANGSPLTRSGLVPAVRAALSAAGVDLS